MGRNLFRRIEVAWPVIDPKLARRVIDEGLKPYLDDRRDAWSLGVSPLETFRRVVIPLSVRGLVTGIVLSFAPGELASAIGGTPKQKMASPTSPVSSLHAARSKRVARPNGSIGICPTALGFS